MLFWCGRFRSNFQAFASHTLRASHKTGCCLSANVRKILFAAQTHKTDDGDA